MRSLTMFADAVRFSTTQQLNAVFTDAHVRVDYYERQPWYLSVTASVSHKGKRWAFSRQFPLAIALDRGDEFYDNYMRKVFPRQVAREVIDMVMDEAL